MFGRARGVWRYSFSPLSFVGLSFCSDQIWQRFGFLIKYLVLMCLRLPRRCGRVALRTALPQV